jgi:maltose-binding protein MalE
MGQNYQLELSCWPLKKYGDGLLVLIDDVLLIVDDGMDRNTWNWLLLFQFASAQKKMQNGKFLNVNNHYRRNFKRNKTYNESWTITVSGSQLLHPHMDIQLDYGAFEYSDERMQFLEVMANQNSIDIMSVDQIWLREFAEKGFLTDLTDREQNWWRSSPRYEKHWDGGVYNDKIYGISAISDIRGMWYGKDLLAEADVDPNSLKTCDGYIVLAKKLNDALKDKGIQGMHLVGASHSPDLSFYAYL